MNSERSDDSREFGHNEPFQRVNNGAGGDGGGNGSRATSEEDQSDVFDGDDDEGLMAKAPNDDGERGRGPSGGNPAAADKDDIGEDEVHPPAAVIAERLPSVAEGAAGQADDEDDEEAVRPLATGRSQSMLEVGERRGPAHLPMNYGSVRSRSVVDDVSAASDLAHSEDDPCPSTSTVDGDTEYRYVNGMLVQITKNESDLPPQKLPETLRYIMLNVVGTRPRDEIKFRRLKYRVESESQSLLPESPFVPRATKSQIPHAVLRQQSKRATISRTKSIDRPGSVSTSVDASADQSSVSVSCSEAPPPDNISQLPAIRSEEGTAPSGLVSTTRLQKSVLIVLALNDLIASMALSILAPFFPKEARKKGISDALSGWVFGIFALVQCLTSPVFGKLLPRLGARFLSQSGLFFAGGCTVLFGMLQFVSTKDNGFLFVVYCFVLRMFMAVGCAANSTATFAIAARTFPDNPATVFGLLETAVGFGLMMGPAIGGVLYEVGGFLAPFAAIGAAMLLCVPLGIFIIPSDAKGNVLNPEEDISIRDYLRIPAVTITAMAAFIACMAWVMPDPTLEPHLSRFNLSPTLIGLIFLLISACYAVCSPLWGWVADNVSDSAPMMVFGFAGTGIGFLILGPSPVIFIPEDFSPLWLDIIALIIIGLSISLALVPTYDKILDAAEKAGIPDTLANCSTVAGLWNASYSFGEFVGPVLAGWMMGVVGFPWTMSVAAFLCFFMSIIMLILYLYEKKFGPTGLRKHHPVTDLEATSIDVISDEQTPLLSSVRS